MFPSGLRKVRSLSASLQLKHRPLSKHSLAFEELRGCAEPAESVRRPAESMRLLQANYFAVDKKKQVSIGLYTDEILELVI